MKHWFSRRTLLTIVLLLIISTAVVLGNQSEHNGVLNGRPLASNFESNIPSAAEPGPLQQLPIPDGYIELVRIADNLAQPVDLENAGDDRLFVIERKGRIRIIDANLEVAPRPFLDISSKVFSTHQDSGLLGLAFHPDYATNGYFYIYYTYDADSDPTQELRGRLSRFTLSSNPQIADPASEIVIIEFAKPFLNHNGGTMKFGADGSLFLAIGDGGKGGDMFDNAQNTESLLGKVLRIDVDNHSDSALPDCGLVQNYKVPADNPWADGPGGVCDAIWIVGVRSPWRLSIDGFNQDLWIADVGQGKWEEINRIKAGETGTNLGWRCYEGTHAYKLDDCGNAENYQPPVYEYNHADIHCAVIGGEVYRGRLYPQLYGHYLFSDYCSGFIRSYEVATGEIFEWQKTVSASRPVAFGKDVNGEMYIVYLTGQIYRLENPVLNDQDAETQP